MMASLLYYEKQNNPRFRRYLIDTAKEAKPFLAEFTTRFARQCGVTTDMLEEQIAIKKAVIIDDPQQGWKVEKKALNNNVIDI